MIFFPSLPFCFISIVLLWWSLFYSHFSLPISRVYPSTFSSLSYPHRNSALCIIFNSTTAFPATPYFSSNIKSISFQYNFAFYLLLFSFYINICPLLVPPFPFPSCSFLFISFMFLSIIFSLLSVSCPHLSLSCP